MADQLARGIFANFGPAEHPFDSPNGMEENLRLIDDVLALYTLAPPSSPAASLPASPENGAGQIFTNGAFAVFNGGTWRWYPARKGIRATLFNGLEAWSNTGSGWSSLTAALAAPITDEVLAEVQPLVVAAENARDASFALGPKFLTEAAGRAAVADGAVFLVVGQGSTAAYEYRRVNSGASELIATYPSLSAVLAQRDQLSRALEVIGFPSTPVPDGGFNLDTSHYVFASAVSQSGVVGAISFFSAAAGTVRARVYDRSGDTFSVADERIARVAPGAQTVLIDMPVAAGQYLGFAASGSGVLRYSGAAADGAGWFTGVNGLGTSSFSDTSASPTLRLHIGFQVQSATRVDGLEDRVAEVEDALGSGLTRGDVFSPVAKRIELGQVGTIAPGTGGLDNGIYVFERPASKAGTLTQFRVRAVSAGSVRAMVFARSGDTFSVVAEQTVAVASGHNAVDIDLPVLAGQYVGAQGVVMSYQVLSVDDAVGFYSGGGTTTFVDSTPFRSPRILFGFTLEAADETRRFARACNADIPYDNMLILGAGQSLMEGSRTNAYPLEPVTTAQEFDTVAFGAYDAAPVALLPATAANSQRTHPSLGQRGEWPGLGAAAQLRNALMRDHGIRHTDVASRIVIANTASDGQRIGLLGPGSIPYAAGIAKATALGGLVNGSAGALAVIWAQGESDGPLFAGTDPAAYLAALKALAVSYDIDLRAATGQSRRVPLISYQTCSTGRAIALAQRQAALESGLLFIACPMYQFQYYDQLHIDPVSSRRLGAYFGEAIKRVCIDGEDWAPLQPIYASVIGNSIVLTMNRSGLALDTTIVPAQANFGFSVVDGSGAPREIQSVSLRNGNQVRITCTSAPSADWVVRYGDLVASGKAPYVGGAGNLRDSAGDFVQIDGYPLHNWCEMFDFVI